MTEPEKQCTQCLAFKPLGDFGNDKSKKDGKKHACKYCKSEANRKYYAANPEKIKEANRKCRAENPEKYKEYDRKACRKYYAANPEKIKESHRQYRAANPEKRKESHRQYYTRVRHARNQCAVFNAQNPNKWELLQSKLKALDSTKTKEKE